MANRGQMNPNLVGPAGFEAGGEETSYVSRRVTGLLPCMWSRGFCCGVALQYLPVGHRCATTLSDRHAVPGPRVAIDRPVNLAMRAVGGTPDKGEVTALDRRAAAPVIGKLRRECRMCAIVRRDHRKAGRII